MSISARSLWCLSLLSIVGLAVAQSPAPIVTNQNRVPAGTLAHGVLTLKLEIAEGAWHPEAENGPVLYVEAFRETGKLASIPGPLVRVPEGTTLDVTVTNTLKKQATLYGFNTRPGDPKAGIVLKAGERRELTFAAGAPGTYYYWARVSDFAPEAQPLLADAQLNGAYIVDPPGPVPPDRIFLIDGMFIPADAFHQDIETLSINGKSYPYTERLEYTQGETVRWRVINTSFGEHPMHLHGSFFDILSLGDFEKETAYPVGERESVVTQDLAPTQAMMMEWKPPHEGRWLFHCHFSAHISNEGRVPVMLDNANAPAPTPEPHDGINMMPDMAGLVLAINVKPALHADNAAVSDPPLHRFELKIEPAADQPSVFRCILRDRTQLVAAQDPGIGPPMVVTRGEPVEVTIVNHLTEPTIIHWHGLVLDSYYDGVMGAGVGSKAAPMVAPGTSFVARFTPTRAGTFIYHTHSPDVHQLTGGVYGPLIVLNPGEQYDPKHDKVLAIGSRDADFYAKEITLNGSETPAPLVLHRGEKYRLRLFNMAPELQANLQLGTAEHPVTWRAIAKDGADLPSRMAITGNARLHIVSGEAYDFEFQPDTVGEIPLQIENELGHAKLAAKIVVQ